MKKKALITGATAGIGLETARALKAQGYSLILTGRREERLSKLRDELGAETLMFDVSDRAQVEKVLAQTDLSDVHVLVNNAGLAIGTASLQTVELDHVDAMIDTNLKGLLYVTRLVLPSLIKNSGHVVNIGSVAGRWTYAGGAVYSASKFAVRALTEALRLDLLGKPVRVTNIEPGMVETEFSEVRYEGDKEKAAQVYKGMTPLKPSDIAETIAWCVSRPAHVNIQELVIYPVDQAGVGPYISRK
jgi:3-hydroxy acid dehydrogenase/malonic semialdehyde reductase